MILVLENFIHNVQTTGASFEFRNEWFHDESLIRSIYETRETRAVTEGVSFDDE